MALIYQALTKQHLKKLFPTSNDFVSNGSGLLNIHSNTWIYWLKDRGVNQWYFTCCLASVVFSACVWTQRLWGITLSNVTPQHSVMISAQSRSPSKTGSKSTNIFLFLQFVLSNWLAFLPNVRCTTSAFLSVKRVWCFGRKEVFSRRCWHGNGGQLFCDVIDEDVVLGWGWIISGYKEMLLTVILCRHNNI